MSANTGLGLVQIQKADGETLKIILESGARLECFATPQLGHPLVVVVSFEGEVVFYDVGVVTGVYALTWDEFEVDTYISGDESLTVYLHPSLESPY
ncbi:MAG: hypothetical protein A3F33_02100 [Candidatus Woykebacteria bacterium RIFCSPHIGHO2_12_FULL_43_10]|nr:MAG: hypothetical protein A2802_01250 [Candidatus Woykebacteria bacterium RIFCSPHIGHO2_01_FULL_43_29]OGY29607.1 MAG: hypothetical protein A3F33_02100 [Candidatus Woykebacteria bacterium RIFCSPHIGHO2_12_FULL_43_10]